MADERTGLSMGLLDDVELVRRAEELGYESVWTGEGQGKTAFGKLERWATVTDEIGLGASIVNVYSRSPATVAQSIATLDAHSDGRASLGLGVAHPGVVEAFHGMAFDRPLARLSEYLTLVRRYLRGEGGSFEGEFFAPERTRFWEAFDPVRTAVPIYNAALGPANVRLTGEHADGWMPYLYPLDRFREAQEWLAEGTERAGRRRSDLDVAMYLLVVVDDDRRTAIDTAANHVVQYFRTIPGYYERVAREAGYEAEVEAAKAAPSDEAAAAALSDELVESLGLVGTEAAVLEQLLELREAGVNLPIVRPPIGADRETVVRTMTAMAPGRQR